MKNRLAFTAAVAAFGCVPMAMAEFELTFDMAGTTVERGAFVYGSAADANEYAGREILRIGVRDLNVSFMAESEIAFAWALDLSTAGYGAGIFIFASEGPFPMLSSESFTMDFDISGYQPQVLPADYYGDWNLGTFVGSNGVDNALTVTGGEMYLVLDGDPVPTPGALTLLGIASIVGVRQRHAGA